MKQISLLLLLVVLACGSVWAQNKALSLDGDGDYEELYSYGARSFSIWSPNGELLYDSGNLIAEITLALTPDRFNDDDGRSDDKGAEPESIEKLCSGKTTTIA